MAQTILDNLRTERDTLISEIEGLMSGDFDPQDKVLVEARGKAEALDSKIKSLVEFQASKDAASRIDSIAVRSKKDIEEKQTREVSNVSIGEAWTRSRAYADYKQTPKGNSLAITLPFDSIQRRAPILTTSFPGLIQPDRIDDETTPIQPTPLLDLIRSVRVSSNSVEWVFFPAALDSAAVVPEGADKPEATVAPVLKTISLDTLAHFAQYSRQFGEDAPGLVDYLNASLRAGINNLRETAAVTALTGSADIPVSAGGADLLTGIRVAIGEVQSRGYSPNAVVLNPADYASLDISVLGATLNGPLVQSSYWGIRPVAVSSVPVGTAFVGNFTVGMVELVRTEVSVYTTDSHGSTFIANVLTTLVEARTKPLVHQPNAISKVSGTGGAPSGGTLGVGRSANEGPTGRARG